MNTTNALKKLLALMLAAILCISMLGMVGCRESEVVSYNISKEADSFEVTRKITVINARTDTIVFELQGVFSLENTSTNELSVICKTDDGYKKHFVYLNDYTLYFVEDIGGADVSSLAYEILFYPQRIGNLVDVEVKRRTED